MSNIKAGYKYTESDEWVSIDGDIAVIGISDYAQQHLGDIVFVEMKDTGIKLKKGEVLTTIESVKSASDIFSPLSGELIEINSELDAEAGLVNQDPYGKGWIAKIKIEQKEELDQLMDHSSYEKYRQD